MKINERKAALITAGLLSAASLLLFLLYYLSTYIIDSAPLSYVWIFISELAKSALPATAAAAMLISYAERGVGFALLRALGYTLCFALYHIPYFAFENAYLGYEIGAVLTFTAIQTAVTLISTYVKLTVLLLLIIFVTKIFAKRRGYEEYGFSKVPDSSALFDFSEPVTAGFFAAAAVLFLSALLPEIVDTVRYIRDYAGAYRTGEIIYVALRYLFILSSLFITHAAAFFVRIWLSKYKLDSAVTE